MYMYTYIYIDSENCSTQTVAIGPINSAKYIYIYSSSINIPTDDAYSVGAWKNYLNQTNQVPATCHCLIDSLFSKFFSIYEKN